MTIYFVHKYSRLKGPYDITDGSCNRIMRMGDICIKEYDNELSVLLIVCDQNNWKKCKIIGKKTYNLNIGSNKLLFSFNGINKRNGDISILKELTYCFKSHILETFFTNALEILEYKCDFWNIAILHNLLITPVFEKPRIYKNSITLFESYLEEHVHDLFIQLYKQHVPLKEIYLFIRKEHATSFRKSLQMFLSEHPQATIYDLNE